VHGKRGNLQRLTFNVKRLLIHPNNFKGNNYRKPKYASKTIQNCILKLRFKNLNKISVMNKIAGILITVLLLFFTACGGSSDDTSYTASGEQEIEMVTDSVSIEMEELKEEIEQTLDELESLLDEIDE
jgi:hypothetical protein